MTDKSLLEQLDTEIRRAMKEKKSLRLSVLRMLKTALTNEKIARKGDLGSQDELTVVSRLAKQRVEAASGFRQANREELASKEEQELSILQEYLPQQLSEDEIGGLVDSAVEQCQAASPKDMGKVMKIIAPQIKGKADGKLVSQLVQRKLSAL